jgi:hypothetical protein
LKHANLPGDPAREATHYSRREFLRLATAAGLFGPAVAGCGGTAAPPVSSGVAATEFLGKDYLARGLVALGVAHRRGWLQGHSGAAVIASCYFRQDNGLDERASRALQANIDAYIERNSADFPSPVPGRGAAKPARIVERLDRQIPQLRSGGHDAIFASLALRALSDLPEFATPSVVDGICKLLETFSSTQGPVRESRHNHEHPLAPFRGPRDIAEVALRATLRPWSHVRQVGASGVLHWVTHAEALVTLEELGHGEVARRGHAAMQLHINLPVENDDAPAPDGPPIDWLGPDYWESDAPRRLFGGSWLAGHAFKLPYSLFRLLRRIDDPELRKAGVIRAAKLTIPFA